ncbi:hypothetical protein SCHPADRAFT_226333 [Schizopora paradoxa]|uniref:Uncharacterized protein n=1 Tax=Schizopora paradoxa TaxID=27342 RepID=A0A0H2S374_9AGAM|nr:hypothetical protein SCHPADRAFT_226333 [Schizopora paradoxa]
MELDQKERTSEMHWPTFRSQNPKSKLDGEDHYETLKNQVKLMNEKYPLYIEFSVFTDKLLSFPSPSCRVKVVVYRSDFGLRTIAEAGSQSGYSEAARKCMNSGGYKMYANTYLK